MCAEPAMAIARSRATWDFMAVEMVRRKNLKSLEIQRRLLGFAGDRESVEGCICRSVDVLSWLLSLSPMESEVIRFLDFLREIGHEGSMFEELGGGGRGEAFISPIRRRVSVS